MAMDWRPRSAARPLFRVPPHHRPESPGSPSSRPGRARTASSAARRLLQAQGSRPHAPSSYMARRRMPRRRGRRAIPRSLRSADRCPVSRERSRSHENRRWSLSFQAGAEADPTRPASAECFPGCMCESISPGRMNLPVTSRVSRAGQRPGPTAAMMPSQITTLAGSIRDVKTLTTLPPVGGGCARFLAQGYANTLLEKLQVHEMLGKQNGPTGKGLTQSQSLRPCPKGPSCKHNFAYVLFRYSGDKSKSWASGNTPAKGSWRSPKAYWLPAGSAALPR